MPVTLQNHEGKVHISQSGNGEKTISVNVSESKTPNCVCKTSYNNELLERIVEVKGLRSLCYEIKRYENLTDIQHHLKYALFSFISEDCFHGKRILDFGCGSGSGTLVLARMFPDSQIVGVDIDEGSLSIARLRSKHYNFDNVTFLLSPSSNELPFWLGNFDYVNLGGVYEHFLPDERKVLLLKIWSHIKPGGILFINQTPHRYFPIETHAASLPLINYLPDKVTLKLTRKYSKRIDPEESWEDLLRKGIRGATQKEISSILNTDSQKPIFLQPTRLEIKDNIDLWFQLSNPAKHLRLKKCFKYCAKTLNKTTGIMLTPSFSVAIKKPYLKKSGLN